LLLDSVILPRPPQVLRQANLDSHTSTNSFGVVYANKTALDAMTSTTSLAFPSGAIIVREKLPNATSKNPDLLAVMMKHEKGFNPAANDWEFLLLDGTATKIERREKKGQCQQCHSSEKKKDFVFRSYSP
jgi:hypothetical protein